MNPTAEVLNLIDRIALVEPDTASAALFEIERHCAQRRMEMGALAPSSPMILIDRAIDAVSKTMGVDRALILTRCRESRISLARNATWFVLRHHAGFTLNEVATPFGRHKRTVSFGLRTVKAIRSTEVFTAMLIDQAAKVFLRECMEGKGQ